MSVTDRGVDPIVGAERAARRRPATSRPPGFAGRRGHVRAVPQIEATDAVLVPSPSWRRAGSSRSPRRRRELVVAAGHRVEHERRHRRRVFGSRCLRSRKLTTLASAKPVHALVFPDRARAARAGAPSRRRRLVEHRNVGSVAQVQAIGNDVALGIERRAPARRRHSWHQSSSPSRARAVYTVNGCCLSNARARRADREELRRLVGRHVPTIAPWSVR